MAEHLPIPEPNTHVSELHSGIPKQQRTTRFRFERPGPVQSKKVRAVCRTCNNTWMSAIEERAKPVLIRAFGSADFGIEVEEVSALSSWAVIKAIVGEHASSEHLTPVEDRKALRLTGALPDYFRVFIARHRGRTQAAYLRHSTTVSRSMGGPVPPLSKGITRNIQLLSLWVGSLYLQISAIRAAGIDVALLDPLRTMLRIYPTDFSTRQAAIPTLTDTEILFNTQAMDRLIHHPRVRWGGDLP
jgi:hypothetical protein